MATRPLTGSERIPMPGAQDIGDADPNERLEVSVLLRRRAAEELKGRVDKVRGGDKSTGHLSRDDFAARYGADPGDVAAVQAFAQAEGLAVVAQDLARRTVVLSGTVGQFNQAFGVSLRNFEHDGGTYRGRVGAIHIPEALANAVEAVLGLDNRPQARPHFRARSPYGNVQWRASQASAASFTPGQLAALYSFPAGDGAGECIAIIELGGGYRPADLKSYFASNGVSPAPSVITVSVDHAKNKPTGDPNGPDGEVMLDIEVAGSIASKSKIAVYFAPNTDAGFIDAVTTAAHDQTNKPSIISISWGGPESSWTAQSLTALDQAFQAAVAMGVTVCVASGDNGSSDGATDGADHVDFPASSPHALACGGTSLRASGAKIAAETVWNDGAGGGASGGGVSTVFALPSWQAGLDVKRASGATAALTNRGVPDVCGDADPETGYAVRIDGTDTTIGGTSAVAPLWAGLLARINALKGAPVGFVNAELYANRTALNDITAGDNGDFFAAAGWDACTGLGSPEGAKVDAALTAAAVG
jgi:kumamolisin